MTELYVGDRLAKNGYARTDKTVTTDRGFFDHPWVVEDDLATAVLKLVRLSRKLEVYLEKISWPLATGAIQTANQIEMDEELKAWLDAEREGLKQSEQVSEAASNSKSSKPRRKRATTSEKDTSA